MFMNTMSLTRRGAVLALGAALTPAVALADAPPASAKLEPIRYDLVDQGVILHVVDVSPRFLAFYDAARDEPNPDVRFALWQRHYGFAAVPPGPRGEAMARDLLDAAWPRYRGALPIIRAGARCITPDPQMIARKIAMTLCVREPVEMQLTAYVGAFEDNAFTAGQDGMPIVNIPLEMSPRKAELILPHEITHAVHMRLAGMSGGWERSIAATVLMEGLAIHVTREVAPGRPDEAYIEYSDGWLREARRRETSILTGIRPELARRDGESVYKFTMGRGTTGLEREAYYAGYAVVKHMRSKGMTLCHIARIREDDMPRAVGQALDEMLAENEHRGESG